MSRSAASIGSVVCVAGLIAGLWYWHRIRPSGEMKIDESIPVSTIPSETPTTSHPELIPQNPADARRSCEELAQQPRESGERNPNNDEDRQLTSRQTAEGLTQNLDNRPEASNSEEAAWSREERHWAFRKPVAVRPPDLDGNLWSQNGIDDFILARLQAEQLSASPAASRTTLIRRLSLDLVGLPPAPEDVDEFEADPSPDAAERLIDRLMASPHFGEKWAGRWLDLARYADTNGFEFDAPRTMWLYRDWVIDAWNRDLPFDQFTAEQLAGDLLPDATDWQRVATGFWRNSPVAPDITTHRFDMLTDRVNTLGAVWFGLTVECAQCHDHKSDPLTQAGYYRLYAIFNNSVDEVEGVSYTGDSLQVRSPLNGLEAATLVLAERKEPVATHVKVRGSPEEDGDLVEPGFPAFLHAVRCGESDRLALACWLIDENNPLTPRIAVNRLWESLFGIGLVKTSGEFGLRGERPSHPELLDWLSVEFRRGDWSQKRLLRSIVGSAAYRQSSKVTPALQDRDPENRLLARASRVRIDAEQIRDVALSAAGLLSEKLGGPSVFPEQPLGTTDKLEFASLIWIVSSQEDRYRRGLYTFWKRTALYPGMALFNAPNRTASCTRRDRFTSPLQALVTLNDPVFFEAAIHLGRRMKQESDGSPDSAIARGFRLCLGRKPTAEELDQLLNLYRAEFQQRDRDPAANYQLLRLDPHSSNDDEQSIRQWATLTLIANVLLSLDETITKE